jgi:hypothetical protein
MAKGKKGGKTRLDYLEPLKDTLSWINEGRGLLKRWQDLSGKGAEQMTASLQKRLKRLQKQSNELWDLTQKEKRPAKGTNRK